MPAALPCEFIDRARLDSQERSNFLFGHNVLSDRIKVSVREQTGAISYWPHRYNWLLKFMLDRHGQKSYFRISAQRCSCVGCGEVCLTFCAQYSRTDNATGDTKTCKFAVPYDLSPIASLPLKLGVPTRFRCCYEFHAPA
jgi:hypothetical protein